MPALVAGIHVLALRGKDVDGRNKSGHDAWKSKSKPNSGVN
jgi:hypothetical protein